MGLVFGDGKITGDTTEHTAVHEGEGQWGWHVSWLPGRDLGRMQAEGAMHIAEMVGQGLTLGSDWQLLEDLAYQLDLSGPRAVALVCETPPAG